MAQGAEAAIAEAAEVGKAASNSGDPDLMRVAEAFNRCSVSYAEKMAPREFGQLVKLGNPDGGELQLKVISYAVPAIEAPAKRLTAEPAVAAIAGKFDELDPA
jgi:hypothetical protein